MLHIGQILFLIADSKTIEPVQIISKQTKEDFNGLSVEHVCAVIDNSGEQKSKIVLENTSAKFFSSVEEAQEHLLKISSKIISNLAENARKKMTLFKNVSRPAVKTADFDNADYESVKTSEQHVVILPDGTQARIHVPENLI